MLLPNFIILGAAKAGTTALYHYLKQHPQIGMSRIKETNYLALKGDSLDFRGSGDCDYIKRFTVTNQADYFDQFADCSGKLAIGEASPLYLYSPKAPAEIKSLVPDAKLIAILRDPVDRAYSAFLHLVRDGRETTRDFAKALHLEPTRIADYWEHIWHYVAMGRYADQLARYFALFDRSQIKILLYRDFRIDPLGTLADLQRFLEVDDSFQTDVSTRHNAAMPVEQRPPLNLEARRLIEDTLSEDIFRLEAMLGRDLSHWRSYVD